MGADLCIEAVGLEATDRHEIDLDTVRLAIFDAHREAAILSGGKGIVLLIAGGMSWGDPPTRLYESLCRLQESSVIPDARWPQPNDAAPH